MVKFIGDKAIDYGPTGSNSAQSHPPIVYEAKDFPKDFFKPRERFKRKRKLDPDWVDPMLKAPKKEGKEGKELRTPLASEW